MTIPLERLNAQNRPDWQPAFSPWRHGGWYVDNLYYPSGAVGCVSRNYADKKWRIACDPRPFEDQPTFPNRTAAALGERDLIAELHPEILRPKLDPAKVGELRHVEIDVGSMLCLTTETTVDQVDALVDIVYRYRKSVRRVALGRCDIGLPSDYVSFSFYDPAGDHVLTGGIDTEGRVST